MQRGSLGTMGGRTTATLRLALRRLAALLTHDPAQTGLLTTVALVGLALIGLWGLYGDLFLANWVVVLVTEILIVPYSGLLALLTGRLVRSQDRWQVESALTLRDLLSERTGAAAGVQGGSPFYAHRLRLQLQAQLERCRQYGTPLTVVAVRLEVPGQAPTHALFSQANHQMAELLTAHHEMLVAPTAVGLFEYVFYLPNHDRRMAKTMAAFVAGALKRYRCSFGFAVYPEDGADAATLLRQASERSGLLRSSAA